MGNEKFQVNTHSGMQNVFYVWHRLIICFFAVLLGIHFCLGIHQGVKNWIVQLFCLQGMEIYVSGAEHIWFMTVLLLCYLLTPLLDNLKRKYPLNISVMVLLVSVVLQALTALFVNEQLGRYWLLVNFYMFSYLLGSQHVRCTKRKGCFLAAGMAGLAVAGRLIGKALLDETVYYNIFISGITHCLLALAFLFVFQHLFGKRKPNRLVRFLDSISYEVYLVHYMFILGPISCMNLSKCFLLNVMVAFILSIATAAVLHQMGETIGRKVLKGR